MAMSSAAQKKMVACLALVPLVLHGFVLHSPATSVASRAASTAVRAATLEDAATATATRPKGAKKNLSGRIPDCPATVWNAEGIDIEAECAKEAQALGPCPLEWTVPEALAGDADAQKAYFREKREIVGAALLKYGCVWLKGFDLMKTENGFRAMYEALNMKPCLDPIHTSGLRAFASESDAIYEEVNKPSLSQHYIGLHQESTHKKTATFGAFVCFKPATVEGGEFLIADAAKILRDLDPKIAREFYDKQIRISVSNLDFDFLAATGPLKPTLMTAAQSAIDTLVAPKFDMDLEMLYGADGKPMRLQAVEQIASPVNRHPKTSLPLWFCNVHNHARYLRDNRKCNVPEVGMTEVYYGDLSRIPSDVLDHVNAVSEKNIAHIPMAAGDVLLCDNYRVLHGRDVFQGDRYHAVTWFEDGFKEPSSSRDVGLGEIDDDGPSSNGGKPGNVLNTLINKYVVDAF